MDTYFAPAERLHDRQLEHQIEIVSAHPMLDGLMQLTGGCIAVLNSHRQVVSLNATLLKAIGIDNFQEVLGLRPGEALGCYHAHDMPDGCGTGRACASCGAAIAIVACLDSDQPVERTCSMTVDRQGREVDLFFLVHATPLRVQGQRFILIFLQDITRQQQLEALERIFFHDINNTLMGLVSASDLLVSATDDEARGLIKHIRFFASRLSQEVALQRYLIDQNANDVPKLQPECYGVGMVFDDLERMMAHHPAAKGKTIERQPVLPGLMVTTDLCILIRVLSNMMVNALEAAAPGERVRLGAKQENGRVIFSICNAAYIPEKIAQRMFQRNYSSKGKMGRGLGTYSMKLFGEKILGGQVSFTSTPSDGTTFYFSLPLG